MIISQSMISIIKLLKDLVVKILQTTLLCAKIFSILHSIPWEQMTIKTTLPTEDFEIFLQIKTLRKLITNDQ